MQTPLCIGTCVLLAVLCVFLESSRGAETLEIAGVTVTPHQQSPHMRYRREPDQSLGARVQLFIRNTGSESLAIPAGGQVEFRGMTPKELLQENLWAWHDTPEAWGDEPLKLTPGSMTVWQFNSRDARWGVGTQCELSMELSNHRTKHTITLAEPSAWISAVTFLGHQSTVSPDRIVLHVANAGHPELRLRACRLWLPQDNATWRMLLPGPLHSIEKAFPKDGTVPRGQKGGAELSLGPLPLTYTAVELQCADQAGKDVTLWAHLRIKREAFDISGGWVSSNTPRGNILHSEYFLKALQRMYVNTAHIADVPGYTDQTGPDGLYTRYPLKYFNRLEPVEHYESAEMLPRVHAVEFLGEPQYGGGKPVPPMEVWKQLAPYQRTMLPTSLTHSEERIWRYYAGLSDYPHYDAYRVSAPSPDAWTRYQRWNGKVIGWGAPLETIGEMSRSLRELNRPLPTAYWSQGPHAGWGVYWGRRRTSPTPDELRLQAYHALSSRITSLYWFNLSLASLLKFPDLIDEVTRVGREIRMLEQFYLEGDAYHYHQVDRDGQPDWDLAVVAAPDSALLFALDLDYEPDQKEKAFRFGSPRPASFQFPLPPHLRGAAELFRVDGDGTYDVTSLQQGDQVEIHDTASRVAIYVISHRAQLRTELERRRQELLAQEQSLQFDPANRAEDLRRLEDLLEDSP